MPKRFIASLSVAAIALAAGSAYSQAQFGTAAEAGAIEKKAVAELKANEAAALEKFNSATGGFRDRDLYVFCYNMTSGAFTAHINKALIGTDVRTLKEKDEARRSARGSSTRSRPAEGTITTMSYNFPKPGTQNPWEKRNLRGPRWQPGLRRRLL